MRFTLLFEGTLASASASQKRVIRAAMQPQLSLLYRVTSSFAASDNKIILDGVEYVAVIPIDWTCKIDVKVLRRTSRVGRTGNADLDNLMKTLADGITAPHGFVGQPAGSR